MMEGKVAQKAMDASKHQSNKTENQVREKKIVAMTSVAAAVFLTIAKLIVGFMTGSLGILAEAAHSALDLVAAIITFFAVRISDRPADDTHPYGHGKVENLSALAETGLLLLTCAWIVYEAVRRLFFEEIEIDPSLWAFLIMGLSIGIDFSRSRALGRVAKKYGSQALEADALHFSTDIWSSAVVIIGLGLVKFGQYRGDDKAFFEHADAIAALVVAVIVVFVSIRLGRRAVDVLLDRAPEGLAGRISLSVEAIPGIQKVLRTRVRNVGNKIFVDLKVDVPRHLSFEETHELTREIQGKVYAISPEADVVVHTIPTLSNEGVLERIQAVAAREHAPIHNIATYRTEQGMWIDLDLEVDPKLSFERAHEQATDLEDKLHAALIQAQTPASVAGINVHIEPRAEELASGEEMQKADTASYLERIRAVCFGLDSTRGCHDITLHRVGGKIYLSFHLSVRSDIPISEVHGIAEEMESRLRLEFPELGRVVIHTEPERG
jgi:cation diffusion facilitator family transporter